MITLRSQLLAAGVLALSSATLAAACEQPPARCPDPDRLSTASQDARDARITVNGWVREAIHGART